MPRSSPVPGWVPDDIPPDPGVYEFTDRAGTTLYVGKSVNLRRRVRSYFYGGGPDDARLAEMLRIARSVRVRRMGSDLEARLEEAERILRGRPPYNKALKRRWRGWYLELPWSDPFPRLRIVPAPRRRNASYYGPFWGRRLPARIARLTEKICRLRSCTPPVRPEAGATPCMQFDLGLCTAPCAKRVGLDAYRSQARVAARLLTDGSFAAELRERTVAARRRAIERWEFEEAAACQARLEWLDELEGSRFALEPGAQTRSWLIALPGSEEDARVLLPVARGKVLPRLGGRLGDGSLRAAVEDACYAIRIGELQAESVFPPEELVPSLMVSRWVQEGAPDGHAFDPDRLDVGEILRTLGAPAES